LTGTFWAHPEAGGIYNPLPFISYAQLIITGTVPTTFILPLQKIKPSAYKQIKKRMCVPMPPSPLNSQQSDPIDIT